MTKIRIIKSENKNHHSNMDKKFENTNLLTQE